MGLRIGPPPNLVPRLLIVAGTHEQARQYARENGVKSWRHVRRELDVLGCTVKEYVLVGTWYDLPRIGETLDALEKRLDRESFEQRVAMRGV